MTPHQHNFLKGFIFKGSKIKHSKIQYLQNIQINVTANQRKNDFSNFKYGLGSNMNQPSEKKENLKPKPCVALKHFQPRASKSAYMNESAMQSIVQHFVHSEIRYYTYYISYTYYKSTKPNEKQNRKNQIQFYSVPQTNNKRLKIIESIILINPDKSFGQSRHIIKNFPIFSLHKLLPVKN